MVPLAQLDRALDCGSRGRQFDPDTVPLNSEVWVSWPKPPHC